MFRGIVSAAAAAWLLAAGAANAELATWNQERVAKYAAELKEATAALKLAIDGIGIQNVAQQNALYQVADTVQMLDTAANGLDHALRNGKGKDETLPRYRRLKSLQRDAEREGRSADIPEAVFQKVFSVGSALIKLAPYYEEDKPREAKPAE